MTARYTFEREELLQLGLSNALVEQIASAVERNMDDYVTLSFAGNPNSNVKSNFSKLCVDTSGNQIYFNPDVGVTTGWVAV